jgi:hypothetical protein
MTTNGRGATTNGLCEEFGPEDIALFVEFILPWQIFCYTALEDIALLVEFILPCHISLCLWSLYCPGRYRSACGVYTDLADIALLVASTIPAYALFSPLGLLVE